MLTFNDDIQGTAAVTLGAVLGAVKVTGKSLNDQEVLMLGAGSAGIGVADGLRAAMKGEGLSEQEARTHFWVVDRNGLLHSGREDLSPEQSVYPQPEDRVSWWPRTSKGQIGLAEVMEKIEATILMGVGVVASGASQVTDAMMLAAARALARNSPAIKDPSASLLPPLTDIRRVAAEIAIAVGIEAQKDGVAPKAPEDELRGRVIAGQWTPA